jgi:hypothetical protein
MIELKVGSVSSGASKLFPIPTFFFHPIHIFVQTIDKHAFLTRINIDNYIDF